MGLYLKEGVNPEDSPGSPLLAKPPKGLGKTCLDCKRYIDNWYCDFTCWHIDGNALIGDKGCLAFQEHFGNFEAKEDGQ